MEIKKVQIGNKEFEFVNESGNTRHGFYHESVLLLNGYQLGKNRCNYLNRTWECYRYQSCMKELVHDLIADRENTLLSHFKELKGYSKMTQNRKDEFTLWDEFVNDERLSDYKALYSAL